MLRALVEREVINERRADYAANLLWSLTGAVFSAFGGEFNVKSWGDISDARPQTSGDDIRETLLERWGGGE